jgi:predicted RNA-binding protein with PUA-like domain
MKLLGKRVLLNKPETKKSTIELSETEKQQIEKELMSKWTTLEVSAVGNEVSTVKPGDKVYVYAHSLRNAEIIEVEEIAKLIVHESEIAIVW